MGRGEERREEEEKKSGLRGQGEHKKCSTSFHLGLLITFPRMREKRGSKKKSKAKEESGGRSEPTLPDQTFVKEEGPLIVREFLRGGGGESLKIRQESGRAFFLGLKLSPFLQILVQPRMVTTPTNNTASLPLTEEEEEEEEEEEMATTARNLWRWRRMRRRRRRRSWWPREKEGRGEERRTHTGWLDGGGGGGRGGMPRH